MVANGVARGTGSGLEQTMLALQASAGNRAVNQFLSGDAPLQVQRLVYIRSGGAWRQKTGGSTRKLHGTFGRRSVGNMMTDDVPRFFETKTEMSRWAKGEIDWMGYVPKERTWVRVEPGSFTVIGEIHTATTMADLVQGLHTSRFRYEPYTENVAPAANPALHAAVRLRKREKDTQIGRAVGNRAHEAEDLHPKILRGLTGMEASHDNKVRGSASELRLLGWAILDAASPANAHAAFGTYQANRVELDALARTLIALPEGSKKQTIKLAWPTFVAFKGEYVVFAEQKIDDLRAQVPPADVTAFDDPVAGWHLAARGDYQADPAHEIMRAEKARDLSLFQHMKRAKADGDLLFGVGELHQNRLDHVLDAEGIDNTDMTTFIADQQRQFTPP